MSNPYVIVPYEPTEENWARLEELHKTIDLRIDPVIYAQSILAKWPFATVGTGMGEFAFEGTLDWRSSDGIKWAGGEVHLHRDLQTIIARHPSLDFIFWHRAFVPARYRLYLSNAGSGDFQELLPGLTLQEMARQIGFQPLPELKMIFHIATQAEWRENIALSLKNTDEWRTYRSAEIAGHGFAQCAGAQQVRRLANALHHGEHGLVLMWLHVEQITAPIEYAELPGVSAPGETFPRVMGALDGAAIGRAVPYEPEPGGIFPWPVDIVDMS
jgi:uncharacterized protein (DUF952 family)